MEGLDSTSFPENWLSLKPSSTTDMEEDDRKVILRLGSPKPFVNRPMNRSSTHEANENRNTCRSFGSEELAKCPVCSRSFGSMKAMHGHMRCHPDRGWRGANPPPPPPSGMTDSSSSITTSTLVLSPPPIPIQWIATGKRGQKGSSKQAAVKKAHECRTCGKSFPTGQALGGHQTIHRPKPPQEAAPPHNNTNANPRLVLDLDLNLKLRPMDED